MARYARIYASIWSDDDFLDLTAGAQRLFMLLFSQGDVSHCGVLPLTVGRWARLAADTDASSVRVALDELIHSRFIAIDHDTEEVLVRSYMKWDGQYISPNGRKAIQKARSQVLSKALADHITCTLKALTGGATEAPPEAPPEPAAEGDASPLQPRPRPRPTTAAAASSPTSADPPCPPPPPDQHDAAAAADYEQALGYVLDHRRRASRKPIGDIAGWTAVVRPQLALQHGHRIRTLLAEGHTPRQAADDILGTTTTTPPPNRARDHRELAARTMVAGLVATGEPPAEILDQALGSHPLAYDAIIDELHERTGWTPPTRPTATVTAIRGAQ